MMKTSYRPLRGLDRKKLRRWLLLFFLALSIPTVILVQQSYSRLKWEAFHQHQLMANELARRIDDQFLQLIDIEERRPFTDYSFLNVAGGANANFVQRSPLSAFPVKSSIPGVIGYFQVDSTGRLMTPLIPEIIDAASRYGIVDSELTARAALQDRIQLILSQNQLVEDKVTSISRDDKDVADGDEAKLDALVSTETDLSIHAAASPAASDYPARSANQGQAAFDDLRKKSVAKKAKNITKLGRLEDLSLTRRYQKEEAEQQLLEQSKQRIMEAPRILRKEKSLLPLEIVSAKSMPGIEVNEAELADDLAVTSSIQPMRISTFESEIDPFMFSQLNEGYFMLYRKVWRNNQRYVQGVLIEQKAFLDNIINAAFAETALSQMSNLLIVYQGNVLEAFSGRSVSGYLSSSRELNGELLYQTRLSDPLSDMQLLFNVTELPAGPGARVIFWLALIMGLVLCGGFYLLYRLALTQIALVNQQQDFVSAVSHELKTPLTSIRMYGEILRAGWASEEKKKNYYDFIFVESERLSRLINNVLLMARLTRNNQQAELKTLSVAELMDNVKSSVSTQVSSAGFELDMHCAAEVANTSIRVDADWFTQIMINLVDNAIKFSAKADKKLISLSCKQLSNATVQFSVRDYGPGIPRQQMKEIFKLFYRSENELTRETAGTGIGLALVHQMTLGMNGKIDVVNAQPGAEFSIIFSQTE